MQLPQKPCSTNTRHQAGDEPRSSKLESDMFTLMAFVLDSEERGVAVPTDRRMALDMRFHGRGELPTGIEYDAAYWPRVARSHQRSIVPVR